MLAKFDGPHCCHWCVAQRGYFSAKMILCPQCGNKRCPKASDHRLDCTGSNEPGQPGSVYAEFRPNGDEE